MQRLVSDVLVRVLGQYVHGITPETVSVGVWSGCLQLYKLAVRPDALAVLFETLGLDLPVTVTAGNIGTLSLSVPWKALRSSPVVLSIRDFVVVASPVSDGDQEALSLRDARLKAARLETDAAVREAHFSVRAATARFTRWRQRITSSVVAAVVGNIEVNVENVIVQYQDASSVRERPYTVTLAVNSMRVVSTNAAWEEEFVHASDDSTDTVRMVYKLAHLDGLVANWIPGIGDTAHETCEPAEWAKRIRETTARRVIHPMNGRLKIALVADPVAAVGKPKVDLDLCFPDVKLAFDDFQYHCLLSTIMYLSDIDRKVRPRNPRARWLWAVERLLPRFRERHEARRMLTVDGMRERREQRELYIRARKAVVSAKLQECDPGIVEAEKSVLSDMELVLPLADILLFRDMADRALAEEQVAPSSAAARQSGIFWTSVGRGSGALTESAEESGSAAGSGEDGDSTNGVDSDRRFASERSRESEAEGEKTNGDGLRLDSNTEVNAHSPSLRLGFLLGRGSIQLSKGGYPLEPMDVSRLVFQELRIGVTTWAEDKGLVVEALLGTIEVIDLQSPNNIKVMYPRVKWAGKDGNAGSNNDEAFPVSTRAALEQISGSFEAHDPSLFRPSASGLEAPPTGLKSNSSSSTGSLQSDGASSGTGCREDISRPEGDPLQYIVSFRLRREPVTEDPDPAAPDASSTRFGMDLAIGGLEALVDGPNGTFVSSVMFWHPREKLPSIMQFLGRAAAPRLAALRMDLQRMFVDRKAPLRVNLVIRGPRFVLPGPAGRNLSLVIDFGTFAMETSGGRPFGSQPDGANRAGHRIDVRCTDYRMTGGDLGVFIVSAAGKESAERLVKPFSLRVLLQVLNDAAYVEAVMDHDPASTLARVRMFGRLSSVRTTISHAAFRHLLEIAHQWSSWPSVASKPSGITPNSPRLSAGNMSMDPEFMAMSINSGSVGKPAAFVPTSSAVPPIVVQAGSSSSAETPRLIAFDMRLELDNLHLELRDLNMRRVVTVSSVGTGLKFMKKATKTELDFSVLSFTVEDGSRGATAPFRRLLHAGTSKENGAKGQSFVHLRYVDDKIRREQEVAVDVLSLSVVCVRETYLALADFFYMSEEPSSAGYVDPFAAVGMTTSAAVLALRERAERGVELSKRAFAKRGLLRVSAKLAGFDATLVTAEGSLASFDVRDCRAALRQSSSGDVVASGDFRCLSIRDLTAAFDIHTETMTYVREAGAERRVPADSSDSIGIETFFEQGADGWTLHIPQCGDMWLRSRLRNLRLVYVQRFVILLKQYLNALRDELQPVLSLKGGILDLFNREAEDSITIEKVQNDALQRKDQCEVPTSRLRLNVVTEDIDIIMPRHSQSPHEGLRFRVGRSSITNEELAAPGYAIGVCISASDVSSYVLFGSTPEGEGSVPLSFSPVRGLVSFAEDTHIVGKLDMWRRRRVPEVTLNDDGNPVLKDGELEREYDPQLWLPALRARLQAVNGLSARLCEAEYTILYFVFTENLIERPEIEFTDIVRGLKTPVLPARRPVQPIMIASNRLPANYSILFDVPKISNVISHGSRPNDSSAHLIGTELENVVGRFDYGVDFRLSLEVAGDVKSVEDLRPCRDRRRPVFVSRQESESSGDGRNRDVGREKSVTLSWDRPYGHRANIMLVVSALRVVIVPELCRDLGMLTGPGFPYLESSAPAPYVRFNGRLLIVTLSRPEVWLMTNEFEGDERGLVSRGDIIAKVQWAALTGRLLVEVASKGMRAALSSRMYLNASPGDGERRAEDKEVFETPILYPLDLSVKYHAGGYDPPTSPEGDPVSTPGSTIAVDAESFLGRVDVNDTATLLAVASSLIRMKPSVVSRREVKPGRFDEWADPVEEGDAKMSIQLALPQARVLFTDESGGHYVPVLEVRARELSLHSNVPWMTNARVELSLDLFNEEKGWWEPGIERFPIELAVSQGRSGSIAINARAKESIEVNVTPSTVSGATLVGKTIKSAIQDVRSRMSLADLDDGNNAGSAEDIDPKLDADEIAEPSPVPIRAVSRVKARSDGRRPSVAAFCVQNWTQRPAAVWQPHDSTRRQLRGDGGELEMDMPMDDILWPAAMDCERPRTDSNLNRQTTMRCIVAFTGYSIISLSASEVGVECITLLPEAPAAATPRETGTGRSGHVRHGSVSQRVTNLPELRLLWDVSMQDGVPVGCLRSTVRLVNETRTVLEVSIGRDLSKSASGSALRSHEAISSSSDGVGKSHTTSVIVKAGDSFCVPVHSVDDPIRVRPALFHAPKDAAVDVGASDSVTSSALKPQRVAYSYVWSDPLSRLDSLRALAKAVEVDPASDRQKPTFPVVACASTCEGHSFYFSVRPVVDRRLPLVEATDTSFDDGWIDLRLQAPIIVENFLPRSMSYVIADAHLASLLDSDAVLARGYLEPMRQSHIHTAGCDLKRLALGLGYENVVQSFPDDAGSAYGEVRNVSTPTTLHSNLSTLRAVPEGSSRSSSLKLLLDHGGSASSRVVSVYSEFWIQNCSYIDLFFKDSASDWRGAGSSSTSGRPKTLLRGCGPGQPAEPFVCFSQPWLAFQRADATEDIWIHVGEEVSDVDKPVALPFENLGIALDVRPGKGRFQRTLVVTVRHTGWIRNRTDFTLQWCQPAALSARGIVLSSHVHTVGSQAVSPLHWDYSGDEKALCMRRAESDGSSTWIWSRPVSVENTDGEFAAKMYRPNRHEQYIARVVVSRLKSGGYLVTVHPEDRSTPPYRIVNRCERRSIAFRQSGADETHPWLVRPGKTTRYSWDDPRAPLKRRRLIVEVIEPKLDSVRSESSVSLSSLAAGVDSDNRTGPEPQGKGRLSETRRNKFELSIDRVTERVNIPSISRGGLPVSVSVAVDGPTKVVSFADEPLSGENHNGEPNVQPATPVETSGGVEGMDGVVSDTPSVNVDVEIFVKGLGLSVVDASPTELMYVNISAVLFRLDRFDSSELISCEIFDVQIDNQLPNASWPVLLWSPSPESHEVEENADIRGGSLQARGRKPFLQLTMDGKYPRYARGIYRFRGVFSALQHIEVAADEDFVLRLLVFVQSVLEATGDGVYSRDEDLSDVRVDDVEINKIVSSLSRSCEGEASSAVLVPRLYVEQLELNPLKLTVSFASSRSPSSVRVVGSRNLMRTLMATFGNVEKAEFRFNALELRHVFDTISHFQSLVTEFYVAQALGQKIALLASNPLVGNPSALFDSIAMGARDFFVEPARAKGSAEFIAGIGRGSSSLLTNAVGGIVGSLGGIPRAVAQGLEAAVGDSDYLAARDSIRGHARFASSPAQGLFTGAMSFGHGIASGASGLVREPVVGAMESGPAGFLRGIGKGVIGGVLKPITGALDLIGEPAIGFRSMMTDINRDVAEPARPSRAFAGVGGNRLVAYDLHASLGQSVLQAVGRLHESGNEEGVSREDLWAWIPLVSVPDGTNGDDLAQFLWVLHRRSAPRSRFWSKTVLDSRKEPHRADKMRCALVTQLRFIVSYLDGQVVWECPLVDIVDTQVAVEANDYLMVGTCRAGSAGRRLGLPPTWERVFCGSSSRRDELNVLIGKVVAIFAEPTVLGGSRALEAGSAGSTVHQAGKDGIEFDVEMIDMSSLEMPPARQGSNGDPVTEREYRVRSPEVTRDRELSPASVRSRRDADLTPQQCGERQLGVPRSLRVTIDNASGRRLRMICSSLTSGYWSIAPPTGSIDARSVSIFEVSARNGATCDLAGSIVMLDEEDVDRDSLVPTSDDGEVPEERCIVFSFMVPMLALNAYSVAAPAGVTVERQGGDVGDRVEVRIVVIVD